MTDAIDVHAHFLPASAIEVVRSGGGRWYGSELAAADERGTPQITTGGRRRSLGTPAYLDGTAATLAWMDHTGVDTQILSLVPPFFGYDMAAPDAAAMARDVNDEIAQLTVDHPDRFLGFATLPMGDVAAAVVELERAMALPGIVGTQLGTNILGENWDAEPLFEVLAAASATGALVFLHPTDVRAGAMLSRYHLRNFIGNPLETTVAAASLIFGGVLDRLPELQVCLAHGGGYLPTAAARFDHGQSVRPEAEGTTRRPPTGYLERFLVDALLHSGRRVRHLVDLLGADHVVMGSDHPADMGLADPVAAITGNELLTGRERSALLGDNLRRVLDELGARSGAPAPQEAGR